MDQLGGVSFVNAATGGSALNFGDPIHSVSQATQTITQLTNSTILQLIMSPGQTKPPFVISNPNGDNVLTVFANGTTKFGAHSVVINPNSGQVTGAQISALEITGKINQGQINDKAVGHDQLGDKAVQGNNIASQAITPDKIFPFTDGKPLTFFQQALLGDGNSFIYYPSNIAAQNNLGCIESKPAGTSILFMFADFNNAITVLNNCPNGESVNLGYLGSPPVKGDVVVLTSDGNFWRAVTKIANIQVKPQTPHIITPITGGPTPPQILLGSWNTFVLVGTNVQPFSCLESKPAGTSISIQFIDSTPNIGVCNLLSGQVRLGPMISSGQTVILTSDGTNWFEVYRY